MTARNAPTIADSNVRHCPICGSAVLLAHKKIGFVTSDVLMPVDTEVSGVQWAEMDPEEAERLREARKGKKTAALVGMAISSAPQAPWNEEGVEIWTLNEMHAFSWFKGTKRHFQMHKPMSYKRDVAKRNVYGHYQWLQKEHPFNIDQIH